jgi:eukaryotic-like serine/threonine-protein kinase
VAGEHFDDDQTSPLIDLSQLPKVSHYVLVSKIGSGGMGEVYLAEDTELNRKVALKFLSPHLCQDADCRARFKREAQAAAKLNHPNIVTVYEVSEFNRRPFFAMEYVEGQPLSELIKHGDCPLDKVTDLSLQICEGLQEAHKAGITHRDIKPANILVSQSGRAKLVDFGLASVAGADKLTKEDSTLGTIGYMSPEQTQGKPTDQRSDLFSFGVMLYEMVSCKSPFKADTPAATMNAIARQTPEPLARYKSNVPAELQRIVSKLLQKDPALRYQTAADVISDLKGLKASSQSLTQIPAKKRRTRYVVVGAAVLVILAVATYYFVKSDLFTGNKPTAERKMLAVLPFENLGSPDDEYFADGITDEITGKLAAIHELGVISRTSTIQYKKTTKNIRQIAKELGVDYILEGTIRWDKGDDTSHVRILPQLIRVSDDTHLWAMTFQRPLTDIFAMQADIATRIAEAMNITLLASENSALQARSTRNLDAYQAYLRGLDYWTRADATMENWQLAVQMFQKAVDLDSTFALAYARLALAHAGMCINKYDPLGDHLTQARVAVNRSLELQPNLAYAHSALGYYYYWGLQDYDRALEQFAIAQAGATSDPEILGAKGYVWRRQGKFRAALDELKQVFLLNPRDAILAYEIAFTYYKLREFDAAEGLLNISIALAPDQSFAYEQKAFVYYLWRGDTSLARATLGSIPNQDNNSTRLSWFWHHVLSRDYSKALSELSRMPPIPENDQQNFTPRVQSAAMVYRLMRDETRAAIYFDSARCFLESELAVRPDDARVHGALGVVYAGLGRKEDAIREGRAAVELCPVSRDAMTGTHRVECLALVYIEVGEYDAALDQMEYLLSIPSSFSVAYYRLDPRYDPLRNLPRYQQLLEKYAT